MRAHVLAKSCAEVSSLVQPTAALLAQLKTVEKTARASLTTQSSCNSSAVHLYSVSPPLHNASTHWEPQNRSEPEPWVLHPCLLDDNICTASHTVVSPLVRTIAPALALTHRLQLVPTDDASPLHAQTGYPPHITQNFTFLADTVCCHPTLGELHSSLTLTAA